MSKAFTLFLGTAEIAGGLGMAFGVLPQLAAIGLVFDHARRHPEEDVRLAHWLLGKIGDRRLEL